MKVETALRLEEWERARHARDFQQSDGLHPMSRGWERPPTILVRNPDGREVRLTVTQHRILMAGRALEGETVSAAMIARSIGVVTSTVTRSLVILAAFKLVAYDVTRGRYGGFTFLSTAWADMRQRSRKAWTKIKDERQKAWDRFEKKLATSLYYWSEVNVASMREQDATLNEGAS